MQSRDDFIELEEDLNLNGIYDILNLYELSDKFLTYINAIETNSDITTKLKMIKNSEEIINELLHIIISRVNPDLNWIIKLDEDKNGSYKSLNNAISEIRNKIDKNKVEITNRLVQAGKLREKVDSNQIANVMNLDYFLSYLKEVISGIIYIPLHEALKKFNSIQEIDQSLKLEGDKIIIIGEEGIPIDINKNRNLFWFIVYCFLFRSSQVTGYISSSQKHDKIPDIRSFKRLVSIQINRQLELLKERKLRDEQSKKEDNLEEGISEEDDSENEDKFEEVHSSHKIINEPKKETFLPEINGAIETDEEEEDDIDDPLLEEYFGEEEDEE